ncbi:hypothetical protein PG996_008050 [Apiospora saccharicola]|uniref:2EXR domain-containing protein n=1 Tax=Apiospora saccharicola TaxID=335842 RepID=A0ABR1UWT2_9PEZI
MFERFREFAPELRQKIWKEFLEQESSHRLVMINLTNGHTTEPHKQLVSPLLSVKHESRNCALRHYTSKHDVCAAPYIESNLYGDIDIEQGIRDAIVSDHELGLGEPYPTIIGSLYLNLDKDVIFMNFNGVRRSGIRHYPTAVSEATKQPCTTSQVYFALADITKFTSVLTNRHVTYNDEVKLRDKTPACICQRLSSYIWIDAEGVKRYLLLWELDAKRQQSFIQEVYLLDGETMWKKDNIREFAWAMCKTDYDETRPILAMVDPTELNSSTYATMRTRYGRDVECMVLEGEQADVAWRPSCTYKRVHSGYPRDCDCLIDNDFHEDTDTDGGEDENMDEDDGMDEDADENPDEDEGMNEDAGEDLDED